MMFWETHEVVRLQVSGQALHEGVGTGCLPGSFTANLALDVCAPSTACCIGHVRLVEAIYYRLLCDDARANFVRIYMQAGRTAVTSPESSQGSLVS